jgi:hypothetical protein
LNPLNKQKFHDENKKNSPSDTKPEEAGSDF